MYVPLILDLDLPNYDALCEFSKNQYIGFCVLDHIDASHDAPMQIFNKAFYLCEYLLSLFQIIHKQNMMTHQI